jgi:metal-responsive CopG/Arc/MetJ family transcriptional regulator
MATVNFSVPDDIKTEFDKVFGDRNKSAVIADLMRNAVIEERRRIDRERIFRALTARRAQRPSVSDKAVRAARAKGRP